MLIGHLHSLFNSLSVLKLDGFFLSVGIEKAIFFSLVLIHISEEETLIDVSFMDIFLSGCIFCNPLLNTLS